MPRFEPAGIDLLDNASVIVTTEVDIAGDIDLVWEVIADNTSWTDWFEKCAWVRADEAVWTAVGQTRTIKSSPFVIEETCAALDAPHRWAIELNHSNLPMARRMIEVLDLTDTSRNGEDRTEVRWTAALEPISWMRPFVAIQERLLVQTWGRSLERLHDVVAQRQR